MRWNSRPILFVGGCLLAVGSIGTLMTPPAKGFELSLYNGVSLAVWLALAVCGCCGVGLLYRHRTLSREWLSGLMLVVLMYGVFLSLPLVRYGIYAPPRADQWLHFAYINDLVATGVLPDDLFYPAAHLLIGSLTIVTGLPLESLQILVGIVFFLVYLLGLYALGKRLVGTQHAGSACLIAATPLVFSVYHVMVMPWFYGLLLVPLGLALYNMFRIQSVSTLQMVALIILPLAIFFFHPITVLLFTIMIVVHDLVANRWLIQYTTDNIENHRSFSPIIIITVTAAFLFWYLSFGSIQMVIVRIVHSFSGDEGAVEYADQAGETQYTLGQLIWEYLIMSWGPTLIYGGLGGAIAVIIVIAVFRYDQGGIGEIEVATQFGVGAIVALAFFAFDLITRNILRLSQYAILFAIVLIGLALWRLQTALWFRQRARPLAVVLLILVLMTGILSGAIVFDSSSVTQSELNGTSWLVDYNDPDRDVHSLDISHRLEVYLDDDLADTAPTDKRTFDDQNPKRELPRRLGYDEHTSIGTAVKGDVYLVTTERDMRLFHTAPENRQSDIRYYARNERRQLFTDPAVGGRIYHNGEYDVWIAEGEDSNP